MARVVLHVGAHKTGSTAVQETLAANRRLLARHGYIYPELRRRDPAHHGLAALWSADLAHYEPRGGAEAAWRALGRRALRPEDVLVLSSEEFSRAHGPGAMDYDAMRGFLRGFERIDVVCVLRDQVSFLQSAYLQVAKLARAELADRPIPTWAAFLEKAMRTGRATGLALDYNALLDRLEEAFGPERVRVLSYAEAARRPGGAIGLVLGEIGCPVEPAALETPAGARVNVTGDPLSVWVASRISAPLRPPAGLVDAVERVVRRRVGGPTMLYTMDEIRMVRARFEEANARLVERLRPRHPDFSLPWMSPKGFAKRGRLDQDFWIELARTFREGAEGRR
jgi:hypothetical protein